MIASEATAFFVYFRAILRVGEISVQFLPSKKLRHGKICAVATSTVTAQRFRRIALALDGAVEGAHMGHPDFRVDKRIFASLHDDNQFGMVKLTPDQQATFIEDHPGGVCARGRRMGPQRMHPRHLEGR